jgi:hypothetical protein
MRNREHSRGPPPPYQHPPGSAESTPSADSFDGRMRLNINVHNGEAQPSLAFVEAVYWEKEGDEPSESPAYLFQPESTRQIYHLSKLDYKIPEFRYNVVPLSIHSATTEEELTMKLVSRLGRSCGDEAINSFTKTKVEPGFIRIIWNLNISGSNGTEEVSDVTLEDDDMILLLLQKMAERGWIDRFKIYFKAVE